MEIFDPASLVAAVAGGLTVLGALGGRRLLRRRGHEHSYDHMTSDGKWRCAVCEAPKKEGS